MSQDITSDHGPKTPPPKSSTISSSPPTPTGSHVPPVAVAAAASLIPPGPGSVRGILDNTVSANPSSPINNPAKEEEVGGFPVRKSSPALSEAGLRNLSRGSLTSQSSVTIPISPSASISNNGVAPTVSEMAKRSMLGSDERVGSSGMVHPPVSPLNNRMMLPQSVKTSDGDNANGGDAGGMTTRVFSPSGVSGIQWRPGSSFQNQHEGVCYLVFPKHPA